MITLSRAAFSVLFAFLTILSFNTAQAQVLVQPVQTVLDSSFKVKAGTHSYYEYQLNQGDTLNLELKVKGGLNHAVNVWFLDSDNFMKYRSNARFSYYKDSSRTVQKHTSYSFQVPKTDYYYLVFDNTKAMVRSRYISAYMTRVFPQHTQESRDHQEAYTKLYNDVLKKLFKFEDFDITFRLCGVENAFSNPNITMCWELLDRFKKDNVPNATHFVFLHELGHSLLNLWGYPTYDNEDVADEFATVMSLMIGKKNFALEAAKYWIDSPNKKQEALSKLNIDDRHTISPQRARNIINWINNEEQLLNRWITILAPQMTDEALQALAKGEGPFKNRTPVKRELANRGLQ